MINVPLFDRRDRRVDSRHLDVVDIRVANFQTQITRTENIPRTISTRNQFRKDTFVTVVITVKPLQDCRKTDVRMYKTQVLIYR